MALRRLASALLLACWSHGVNSIDHRRMGAPPLKQTGRFRKATESAHYSARPRIGLGERQQTTNVTVTLCQAALNAERLRLLRDAWLDDALRNAHFGVRVFVPRGTMLGDAGRGLNVTVLEEWHGDKPTYQAAMSKAIAPCAAGSHADFYAVLDDDVVVDPDGLLKWASGLSREPAIWGRKGCCGVVYGGLMMLPSDAAERIIGDLDGMVQYVADQVVRRRFVVYKPAPFNVDHFFPLAVARLNGAVHETSKIRQIERSTTEPGVFPSGAVALHQLNSSDLTAFINRKATLRMI